MPNDVPDWTIVNQVVPVGGISKAILGDVAAAALAADQGIETFSSGTTNGGGGALASLKAAAGSVIALVGAVGAALAGSSTAVNPLFGQATVSGHLLVAWVTANGSEPTTSATGWVKIVSANRLAGWCAIWARPNCSNAEAAPQFTGGGAGQLAMMAQLAEFSGAATASPGDQTTSGDAVGSTLTLTNPAADVAFGDLILMASRWGAFGGGLAGCVDAFNNGAAGVNAGSVTAHSGSIFATSSFSYAIIPAATIAQPLGVAPWAYDSASANIPAVGSAASVVLAATPGKAWTLALLVATMRATTAAADSESLSVLDGATTIFQTLLSFDNVIDHFDRISLVGLALRGTVGNSMTVKFNGAGAGTQTAVSVGAYLR